MIQLGEDQLQALEMMKKVINSNDSVASLVFGSAGTGKTLLINNLVSYLEESNIPYCLCAPTHKAALVMERYTNREAYTLHKLLCLSPVLGIFELDLRNLLFKVSKSSTSIPWEGVVICDEASMINDDLYQLLVTMVAQRNSHICFFGDFKQLAPVKQGRLSKIINTQPQKELTKIYRQSDSNGLLPILGVLRNRKIDKFSDSIGDEGSLIVANNFKDFVEQATSSIKKGVTKSDILEAKVTAYTNARVDAYNKLFHKLLFGDECIYNNGEFLTCNDNLEFNNFKFFNSMDYVIITEPTATDIFIPNFAIKKLPGWRVELYDSLTKRSSKVSILSSDISPDYIDSLTEFLESLRIAAIDVNRISKLNSKRYWAKYYEVLNSFTTPFNMFFDGRLVRKRSFSYGYASTIHKLQGSSYTNIFVDVKDVLDKCQEAETVRQLEYVALSRTRNNVLILQ